METDIVLNTMGEGGGRGSKSSCQNKLQSKIDQNVCDFDFDLN